MNILQEALNSVSDSISITIRSSTLVFLGFVSVFFTAIFEVYQFFPFVNINVLTVNSFPNIVHNFIISLISTPLWVPILIIILLLVYLFFSIYLSSVAYTALMRTLLIRENWGRFPSLRDAWNMGREKWIRYVTFQTIAIIFLIIFSALYYMFFIVTSSLGIVAVIFDSIVAILLSFFLLSWNYFAIRRFINENVDIFSAIKLTFLRIYHEFPKFILISIVYIIYMVIFVSIASYVESMMRSVVFDFYSRSFIVSVPLILFSIFMFFFIVSFITVFTSAFWTHIYIREESML